MYFFSRRHNYVYIYIYIVWRSLCVFGCIHDAVRVSKCVYLVFSSYWQESPILARERRNPLSDQSFLYLIPILDNIGKSTVPVWSCLIQVNGILLKSELVMSHWSMPCQCPERELVLPPFSCPQGIVSSCSSKNLKMRRCRDVIWGKPQRHTTTSRCLFDTSIVQQGNRGPYVCCFGAHAFSPEGRIKTVYYVCSMHDTQG
jgi:hypothetical protein